MMDEPEPMSAKAQVDASADRNTVIARDQPLILIVDDDPGLLKTLSDILAARGYRVNAVETGREALDFLAGEAPEVALIDLKLREGSGLDVLRHVRSRPSHTQCIVLTGVGTRETAIEAVNLGAYGFIQKPYDPEQLLLTIQRAIEKSQYERALKRSEQQYRRLFDEIPIGLFQRTLDGKLVDVNRAMVEMLGYPDRESLLQAHFSDLYVDPADGFRWTAEMSSKGAVLNFEVQLRRHDGQIIWVRENTRVIQDEAEESLFFGGSLEDVTDRKRSEQALRENEERFRSVTESAPNAILVIDEGGVIRYWNQRASVIFGYAPGEALGRKLDFLFPRRYHAKGTGILPRLGLRDPGERRSNLELEAVNREGREFPIEVSIGTWTSAEGRFYSLILRDISGIKEAQRREQLQARLAAVGQLAAGIAHDFNNTLGAIILYAQILLRQAEQGSVQSERLTTILEQAQRAAELTGQILDFSRKSVMERRAMELGAFLKESQKLLARTLPENIHLAIELLDGPHWINGDPARLDQALMNLALNARDAMPDGGTLRYELEILDYSDEEADGPLDLGPGRWIHLAVSDTGVGIPSENLDHIFEPFFTTKAPGEGTGLGLAQVYGIVKQHDGHIEVESIVGQGTTFHLYFPALAEPEGEEKPPPDAEQLTGQGERLLVVEDDRVTREALGEVLGSLNYEVILAQNGQEALRVLEQQRKRVDLILSDLIMPEMGGERLFDVLRKRYPQIPVILITGYPLGGGTRHLFDQRLTTWLTKPLTAEAVAQAVRKVLQQARQSGEL